MNLLKIEKYITRRNYWEIIDKFFSNKVHPNESIIINGFWRSGTTFIMEQIEKIVGARSYFEPLGMEVSEMKKHFPTEIIHLPDKVKRISYPYIDVRKQKSEMDLFFQKMITGQISTKWTRKSRKLSNVFKRTIIIKLVRGNLIVAYLVKKYNCHNIFIIRHPCGVVASVIRMDSNKPTIRGIRTILESENFINILLCQQSLVNDYLSPFVDHIKKWNTNPFNRIVLSWALLNYVPLKQISDGDYNPFLIEYERFVLQENSVLDISDYLGTGLDRIADNDYLNVDSVTVKKVRKAIPPKQRVISWTNELNPKQINEIYNICEGFGDTLMLVLSKIEKLQYLSS